MQEIINNFGICVNIESNEYRINIMDKPYLLFLKKKVRGNKMNVKLLDPRCMPTRAHKTDAGYDCVCRETITLYPNQVTKVPLGFTAEIEDGHEIQIRGRSGLASKGIFAHVGTVDSGYRGELCALLIYLTNDGFFHVLEEGSRVAQIVINKVETPDLHEVQECESSDRGENGFGSTGK